MLLVDANLLIYAVDADAPAHARARRWWDATLSGTAEVGLAWAVVLAFLRITTRPGILRKPMPAARALAYVDEWLAQPFVRTVSPGPRHWTILRGLLQEAGTAGNLSSDAHLAALAIEHDAELCSSDQDFQRFPDLRFLNPLRPPGRSPAR